MGGDSVSGLSRRADPDPGIGIVVPIQEDGPEASHQAGADGVDVVVLSLRIHVPEKRAPRPQDIHGMRCGWDLLQGHAERLGQL